jgi:predicted dehydrogenase
MKLIQVGIGTYGSSWYERIKKIHTDLEVVVVDKNIEAAKKLLYKNDRIYESLIEAIEKENPDFILNLTPPKVHTEINNIAFDYKLPVLCEKPIAEDYTKAIQIVERAAKENIPFMIAENYRTYPEIRKVKKLLSEHIIGDIVSLHVDFYKCNIDKEGRYLSGLNNPLLEDVAIHIFDLIRYVTESDVKRIFARNFNSKNSWYTGNASLLSIMEMNNGIMASYAGSLTAKGQSTEWYGDWRIDGTEGSMILKTGSISVTLENKVIEYCEFSDIEVKDCLDEFILSLKEKRDGETSGAEYIKTQAMVHFSQESSRAGRMLDIE